MSKINVKESILSVVKKSNLEILKIDLMNDEESFVRSYGKERNEFCKVYNSLDDLDFEVESFVMSDEVLGTVYCQDKDTKEPVWLLSRGDECYSWWEVNRIPDFYKNKEYCKHSHTLKNKIMNISEILKYFPKGTKLYSPIWGEVEFIEVASSNNIVIKSPDGNEVLFYCNGAYHRNGECVLFPSKDQRDWKELKIGDIMIEKNSKYRPFKDIEECLGEMQKHHPFGWIKNCGDWYNIVSTDVASVKIINTRGAIVTLHFRHLLANYHFADGTLFGVKEEE